jgi:hypothetical protein
MSCADAHASGSIILNRQQEPVDDSCSCPSCSQLAGKSPVRGYGGAARSSPRLSRAHTHRVCATKARLKRTICRFCRAFARRVVDAHPSANSCGSTRLPAAYWFLHFARGKAASEHLLGCAQCVCGWVNTISTLAVERLARAGVSRTHDTYQIRCHTRPLAPPRQICCRQQRRVDRHGTQTLSPAARLGGRLDMEAPPHGTRHLDGPFIVTQTRHLCEVAGRTCAEPPRS